MAWYPDAIAKPIEPGFNDPRIIPVGLIYHVRDGLGDSLHPYFSGPSGGIESHWYIRYDGTTEQYRDSEREADANLDGNSWRGGDGRLYGLHSVETEGLEHGEWTQAQTEALKALTVWDAREHDWPLQLIPRWNGAGVGYHVMFGAPGPYTSVAKTCPGPKRVQQFKTEIMPWLESGGDEMTPGELLRTSVPLSEGMQKWFGTGITKLSVAGLLGYAGSGSWAAVRLLKAQQPLLEAAAKGEGLSAEQVQQIAQACADAVPDTLAEDVIDQLAERISG